ncbi:MAG: AP2 domain-containing protein [Planctomycetota bacterium]|jgi:hypothetical protein
MSPKIEKPKTPPGSWALAIGRGHYAILDIEDVMNIITKRWCATKHGNTYYAHRHTSKENVYMHHEIMGVIGQKKEVDHINGNGLDNRKSNLRICSHQENCRNRKKHKKDTSSKYKGVSWSKDAKKWRVQIVDTTGKEKCIGSFESEIEAAKAYDEAALKMFGNFASFNFPKDNRDEPEQYSLFPS